MGEAAGARADINEGYLGALPIGCRDQRHAALDGAAREGLFKAVSAAKRKSSELTRQRLYASSSEASTAEGKRVEGGSTPARVGQRLSNEPHFRGKDKVVYT